MSTVKHGGHRIPGPGKKLGRPLKQGERLFEFRQHVTRAEHEALSNLLDYLRETKTGSTGSTDTADDW